MSATCKLLSRIDFSHLGLAAARARLDADDEPGALQAIIEHFRTRTGPTYLFEERIDAITSTRRMRQHGRG